MSATSKPTINTYVSDMLALERHILQPLEHQAKDANVLKSTHASRIVSDALRLTREHVAALEKRLEAIGGHAGSPIKSGVASVLGVAASAIGTVRKTEISKDLRDDYSALSLASAAYTMLHTTALALHDAETAKLAQKQLAETATTIMRISGALPAIVLAELREEGVAIDDTVALEAEQNVEKAWTGNAHSTN